MRKELIAPCGMNCNVCANYLAMQHDLKKKGFHKSYCTGCRPRGKNCTFMSKQCDLLGKGLIGFCYECGDFPCRRLKAPSCQYLLRHTFATLWLRNGGDSLMLQRLLGHTTLMMTNRYCQAVGCYDAIEAHKRFSPGDGLVS